MTADDYKKIHNFCRHNLVSVLHSRHLEDVVQFVAMEHFMTEGKKDWKFSLIDYCRQNGLTNNRSKLSALAIERSVEYNCEIDQKKEKEEPVRSFMSEMDEFVSVLCLPKRTYQWVMRIQNCRLQHGNRK
jgi:hypothetical protein